MAAERLEALGSDRATILVAQGDPAGRGQLAGVLRASGMEVVEASSADEALAGAKRRPDLVILSAALPDADVHALCARLKREPEMERIPVLYRAAGSAIDDLGRGLGELNEGYVRDPIDPAELVAQVRVLVRLGRTERRLAQTLAKQRFGAAVLAEINEALASPMRLRETLSTAASLLTPKLADAVAVAVLRRDGLQGLGLAAKDPEGAASLRSLFAPLCDDARLPIRRALATGTTVSVSDLGRLLPHAADPALAAAAARIDLSAAVAVPLLGNGPLQGVLFAAMEQGRSIDRDDLPLFEEVARRIALSVDGALLVERLEDTTRWLEQTLQQMPSAVVLAEAASDRIVLANARAQEALGLGAGMEVSAFAGAAREPGGEPLQPAACPLRRALSHAETVLHRELWLDRGGAQRIVLASAAPVVAPGGEVTGAVCVLDDVTELRRAQRERQLLLEQLEQSELRHRTAIRATSEAVWDWRPQEDDLHWTLSVATLFGYPPQAIGPNSRWWFDRIHPDDCPRVMAGLRATLDGRRQYWEEEYRLRRADGSYAYVAHRGQLSFRDDGGPDRMIGAVQDLSRRKEAEARAARLQAGTAALSRALTEDEIARAVVGLFLRDVGVAAAWVALVEGGALEVRGAFGLPETVFQVGHRCPLSPDCLCGEVAARDRSLWILGREVLLQRYPSMGPQALPGHQAWGSVAIHIGDEVVGTVTVAFAGKDPADEDKSYLETVASLCAQALERARLYEVERTAKKNAEHLAELAQEFMGIVGHDLRNPLQAILMASATLQRAQGPSREVVERVSQRIITSSERMGKMIRDLLDLTEARLGGGLKIERTPADLAQIARDIVDELSVAHPAVLSLEAPPECRGHWDAGRLAQVVSNLVGNALQHGEPGRPVRVAVLDEGGEVVLRVSNQGAPIPPELLPVIFEPFRRGSGSGKGRGLGLFIVHEIVQAHGGEISVTSDADGTTFCARLPRAAPGAQRG